MGSLPLAVFSTCTEVNRETTVDEPSDVATPSRKRGCRSTCTSSLGNGTEELRAQTMDVLCTGLADRAGEDRGSRHLGRSGGGREEGESASGRVLRVNQVKHTVSCKMTHP